MKKGIAAALAVSGLVAVAVLGGTALASSGPDANASARLHGVVTTDGFDPAFP
jgi:hypothetical protein